MAKINGNFVAIIGPRKCSENFVTTIFSFCTGKGGRGQQGRLCGHTQPHGAMWHSFLAPHWWRHSMVASWSPGVALSTLPTPPPTLELHMAGGGVEAPCRAMPALGIHYHD